MVNRGTTEGDKAEIEFVRNFNRGIFHDFTKNNFGNLENVYCVHVNTHQLSNTSQIQVKPKSDAYLIRANSEIKNILKDNDFYLNEDHLIHINFDTIIGSGISIKMTDSQSYQIHKFTVNSFLEVFKDPFLGAGAMIYCQKELELIKNQKVLNIWNVSKNSFINYFSKQLTIEPEMEIATCKKIKEYSSNRIRSILSDNKDLWHLVFTGQGVFDSPYCVNFSYIHGKLKVFNGGDFYITTGSKRLTSPTIVVKPR